MPIIEFDRVIKFMVDELLKLDGLRVQYDGFAVVLHDDATSRAILGGAVRKGLHRAFPPRFEIHQAIDSTTASLTNKKIKKVKKVEEAYRCIHCGHLPHFNPLKNCGAIDAAGDECDCQSYMEDMYRPVEE